ncbi:hypothetical protein [Loigolactobacillus binensis]|uniref:AbrB family transcriptional regulator n=1 Tax=Loigolactobacillus binensis TaxID=2559922 RepID=A0ABW3EGB3_9LACO|nr:hypothetical protein [Loigolactobacillus binensis]
MHVRTKQTGTEVVIPVPAEFRIAADMTYAVEKLADGTLQYRPQPIFPKIWQDPASELAQFNKMIGAQDDGQNYGREHVAD